MNELETKGVKIGRMEGFARIQPWKGVQAICRFARGLRMDRGAGLRGPCRRGKRWQENVDGIENVTGALC